jgi:uncharacterized protein involved in exopolysaccharide biosynthesis
MGVFNWDGATIYQNVSEAVSQVREAVSSKKTLWIALAVVAGIGLLLIIFRKRG